MALALTPEPGKVQSTRRAAAVLIMSMTVMACAGSPSSPSTDASGTLVFTAAPLDLSTIQAIIPLGNLNPPGHTIPSNHIYVNGRAIGAPVPAPQNVFAPGDGIVQYVLRDGNEAKLGVRVGGFTYYLGHVQLDPSILPGARLAGGQRIGTTGIVAYGIDLGVTNEQLTVPFVNPARYSGDSLHGDAPLRYFQEPLRSRLYALVSGVGDKDGTFNYDVRDRLAGNWFLEGLPASLSETPGGWPQQLAFVFDNYDPSAIRVSIGGTLALVGAFAVQPEAASPREVGVASGKATYRLLRAGPPGGRPEGQVGILIVQMLAGDRIRAEAFAGESLSSAEFTSGAREYVR